MARRGRLDKGLEVAKRDNSGKPVAWNVRLYHNGRERQFGSFDTKTAAREFYNKAKLEQKAEKFFPERYQKGGQASAEGTLDGYEQTLDGSGKKPRTIVGERKYVRWWKEHLKGKRLIEITPSLLDGVKADLTEQGKEPQTVHHYLKTLRHILYIAERDGKLEHSPFRKFTMPKVRATKTRFLSPEEEERLLEALGESHAGWARLAILTGLRRAEQFTLKWADVHDEQSFLALPTTKTGGVQYVHLSREAKQILETLAHGNPSVWVFPSQNPDTPIDPNNFYRRVFQPAARKAKLEDMTWHTLRHTFASRLAMSGQTESTIAASLRHSGTALVARYAHLSPSHLSDAVESVASFGTRTKPGLPPPSQPEPLADTPETIDNSDSYWCARRDSNAGPSA